MKGIGILAAEWVITALVICAGLFGRQILFINGPRSAAITLGAIGFAMCMVMPTISTWENDKLIGFVRVLSDKIFWSIIYDLAVDPEFQNDGIGHELIKKCIEKFPKSEWLIQTKDNIAGFYGKIGFTRIDNSDDVFLNITCKLFTI